jgi:NifU-like protein involved in Fe-S cluster formation
MIDDIYSAKVLALAANLPHLGRLEAPDGSAEKS